MSNFPIFFDGDRYMSQITNNLYAGSLNSLWTVQPEEANADSSNSASSVSSSQQSKASKAYGITRTDQLAQAAQAAFDGLGLGPSNKVTFGRIEEYRESLKEDFASSVTKGLSEAGVSDDAIYQVVTKYNSEGVEIVTDSADKLKIEQFFRDNPDLVDQFKQIQYLDNLERATSQQSISANMMATKAQLQSMSSLFNTNPSSSIMSSGQGQTYFGTGLAAIV